MIPDVGTAITKTLALAREAEASAVIILFCAVSVVFNLVLALEYGQWYWAAFTVVVSTAVTARNAWPAYQDTRSQLPSQNCRPPAPVLSLPPLESAADGLHVRVRASDLEFYEHTGRRVPPYRPEVWRGDEFVVTCPDYCDTEEQAQAIGEEWICRIRASEELEVAGQHEAAVMVWNI